MNCYAECPGTNAHDLESLKQIGLLLPGSFHKTKFQIFQNKSECSIHVSRPFKYKSKCIAIIFSSNQAHVVVIDSMECGKSINNFFQENSGKHNLK